MGAEINHNGQRLLGKMTDNLTQQVIPESEPAIQTLGPGLAATQAPLTTIGQPAPLLNRDVIDLTAPQQRQTDYPKSLPQSTMPIGQTLGNASRPLPLSTSYAGLIGAPHAGPPPQQTLLPSAVANQVLDWGHSQTQVQPPVQQSYQATEALSHRNLARGIQPPLQPVAPMISYEQLVSVVGRFIELERQKGNVHDPVTTTERVSKNPLLLIQLIHYLNNNMSQAPINAAKYIQHHASGSAHGVNSVRQLPVGGSSYGTPDVPQHAAFSLTSELLRQQQRMAAEMFRQQQRMVGTQVVSAMPPRQEQKYTASSEAALKAVLDGLEATGPGEGEMLPQRGYMTTDLLKHQRLALTWMTQRETGSSQPIGGILADDQGLGKTISTISLIVSNPRNGVTNVMMGEGKASPKPTERENLTACQEGDKQKENLQSPPQSDSLDPKQFQGAGTLVVCPATVLYQWEQEIRNKTSHEFEKKLGNRLLYVYHGKSKGVTCETLKSFAVVLTTYGSLSQELHESKKPSNKKQQIGRDNYVDLTNEDDPRGPKQSSSKRQKTDKDAKGGPLFRVMWHRVVLDEAQVIKNHGTVASHAACALRARSRWCLSGTPMQNSVEDFYAYFRFLRYDPYSKYSAFKEVIRDPIVTESDPARGFGRLQAALQNILLRRTKTSKIDGEPIVALPERIVRLVEKEFNEEERKFYDNIKQDASIRMKAIASDSGGGNSYVNMLWMLLRMRQACNHPFLLNGGASSRKRCKEAKVEAAAARKLRPAMRQSLALTLRDRLTECVFCGDIPEDPVVSVCDHVFCRQCVSASVSNAGQGAAEQELAFHCPACNRALGAQDTFGADVLNLKDETGGTSGDIDATSGSDKSKEWVSSTKLNALMETLGEIRLKNEARVEAAGALAVAAASREPPKVKSMLLEKMGKGIRGNRGSDDRLNTAALSVDIEKEEMIDKVIVFSQWTSMLDLVEVALRKEKFKFRRLDGTMSVAARQIAVNDFNTDPDVEVILVSLKAASLGLNLVSANHVILMDLWYNPATENQAIDRSHRIGQKKAVHVTRIVIKDTVEDKILQLQEKKQAMYDATFEGGKGLGAKLTMQDLQFLFR